MNGGKDEHWKSEEVKKILKAWATEVISHWNSKTLDIDSVAQEICQLFEPKSKYEDRTSISRSSEMINPGDYLGSERL